jgi:putative oxidoreductase
MNIVAWILQVLLALVFLFHFVVYAISPEALVRRMREQGLWPPAIPEGFRRFIGIAELAGAIGLIVPALTHVLPWLVPLAALGLAVVTISATVYHLRRREPPIPAVLAALALVVVYLRWQVVPISS